MFSDRSSVHLLSSLTRMETIVGGLPQARLNKAWDTLMESWTESEQQKVDVS